MSEQRREKARKLRAQGLTHREIGERLGVSTSVVWGWLNPAALREKVRRSNARRHQAKLKWQRQKDRSPEGRGECHSCGGLLGVNGVRSGARTCRYCIGAEHDHVGAELERLWAAGLEYPEIQRAMGWTKGHLSCAMTGFRQQGYDLPYRYPAWERKAKAAA